MVATSVSFGGETGLVIGDGQSAGKYYVEVTVSGGLGGNTCLGVQTLSPSWAQAIGTDLSGSYCYASGGTIYFNGVSSGFTLGAFAAGNVICIALDLTNSKVWWRKGSGNWDGNAAHNPATNTGGISIAALVAAGRPWFVMAGAGNLVAPVFTLNAGDSAFAQAVPSGFTSGWPSNGAVANGAKFDSATATPSLTLSNGGLTVTAASNVTPQRIKCVNVGTTGKYYWEFNLNDGSVNTGRGLANAAALTDNFYNNALDGALLFGTSVQGSIYVNGTAIVNTIAALAGSMGQVAGIAVDFGTRRAWFRVSNGNWNNDAAANPATATNGIDISALTGGLFPAVTGIANTVWRISLNSTQYSKIPAPAGFTVGPPLEIAGGAAVRQYAVTVNSG